MGGPGGWRIVCGWSRRETVEWIGRGLIVDGVVIGGLGAWMGRTVGGRETL